MRNYSRLYVLNPTGEAGELECIGESNSVFPTLWKVLLAESERAPSSIARVVGREDPPLLVTAADRAVERVTQLLSFLESQHAAREVPGLDRYLKGVQAHLVAVADLWRDAEIPMLAASYENLLRPTDQSLDEFGESLRLHVASEWRLLGSAISDNDVARVVDSLVSSSLLNVRRTDWRAWAGVFGLALFAHPYFHGAFRRPFACDYEDYDYDPLGSDPDLGNGFYRFKREGRWGIEHREGGIDRQIVAPTWERILRAGEDCTLVWVRDGGRFGLLDYAGHSNGLLVPVQLEKVGPFIDRSAVVTRDGRMGVLADDGAWRIEPAWDQIWPFAHGAAVVLQDERLGYIDAAGNAIAEPQFDQADDFMSAGVARVRIGNRFGLLRRDGRFAQPAAYSQLEWCSEAHGWQALRDRERTLLRADGSPWIEAGWDAIDVFVPQRWLRVGRSGAVGLLRWSGEPELACEYESLDLLRDSDGADVAIVAGRDGCVGVIDSSGRQLVPSEFAAIEVFERQEEEGAVLDAPDRLRVRLAFEASRPRVGVWSLAQGMLVVPCSYDLIWRVSFGDSYGYLVGVKNAQGDERTHGRFTLGVVNADGTVRVPLEYAWIGTRTSLTSADGIDHIRGEIHFAWSRGRRLQAGRTPAATAVWLAPDGTEHASEPA